LDYRVDEKGKYYTVRAKRDQIAIVVSTAANIIRGMCHVLPDGRLQDHLNRSERFIAITHAEVFDVTGDVQLYRNDVVLLNKEHIVWMLPCDENKPATEELSVDQEWRPPQ
jgi:hypothetical protein